MDKILKPNEVIMVDKTVKNPAVSPNTKYCFTWSSFKNHVMDEVGDLLREEKFVDVTIYCDHHAFRAHRVILCSASPLLRQLLEVNPCIDPCISLGDVPWTHMTWVLQYIYSGQVTVPEEKFDDFLVTARLLQISSLCNSKGAEKEATKALKRPSTSSEKQPPEKVRVSKRIAKKKEKPTSSKAVESEVNEIPIIISTQGSYCDESQSNPDGSEVFYRTQAVMQEMVKDSQVEQTQEIITIQTGSDEVMQVEEIVEVVTSMGGETIQIPLSENSEGEIITADLDSDGQAVISPMKFMFNPSRANQKPCPSLAPKACTLCGKVYSNMSNLRQHVNLVHTSTTTTPCPLCGKDFKSELYMRRHLICAHNVTPVKKEPQTKESRRLMNLKVSTIKKTTAELEEQQEQELWTEMDVAVENLTQSSEDVSS